MCVIYDIIIKYCLYLVYTSKRGVEITRKNITRDRIPLFSNRITV